MKLEAGKKYTDRRGRVYGPLVRVDVSFSCGGLFGENREDYAWYGDGQRSPGRELPSDLVAEYVEPVQPEQEYRLLKDGEPFQDGDEYLDIDAKWCKAPASENRTFNPQIYFPHRRLVEPAAPVESPDDWVTQDRVPERVGIDEWRMFTEENGKRTGESSWSETSAGQTWFGKHGDKRGSCTMEVRCRRKDLPPVPPAEPEFPQYYVSDEWEQTAYIKRTSKADSVRVMLDGCVQDTESPWHMHSASLLASGFFRLVTQAEAEARVKKTRTVVLKEWLCWDDEGPKVLLWQDINPTSDDIEYNNIQNAVETGNTRTVEIPVT